MTKELKKARGGLTGAELDAITDAILESYAALSGGMEHVNSYELPSMSEVNRIVELARELIFPGFVGKSLVRATPTELREQVNERLVQLVSLLRRQIYRGLHHRASQQEGGTHELDCPYCATRAAEITEKFACELVALREAIATDVAAHFRGDPAATGTDEIIFCYPGLYAISVYRVAHLLHTLGAKLIPRMMGEIAHERVGVEIHPAATIGESFFIDHGTGVVIGETATIGNRVRMYQGVTLGAMSVVSREQRSVKRHPTIEDDVIIYAGATILGGETVIGRGAVIGGNCWVTASVAAGAKVTLDTRG